MNSVHQEAAEDPFAASFLCSGAAVLRLIFWMLVAAGAAISGYLLVRHVQLFGEAEAASRDVCSAAFGRGCDAALESPLSSQLGLPLAGWGLVYYGTLVALVTMGRAIGSDFEADTLLIAIAVAGVAAAASLALALAMAVNWAPRCPLCFAMQGVNVALVLVLFRLRGDSLQQPAADWRALLKRLVLGQPGEGASGRWKLLGLLAAGLVGVVLYQWVLIEVERHTASSAGELNPEQLIAQFQAGPRHELAVGEGDPILGPPQASVQVVVFSDFQCAACRRFALQLGALRDRFGDDIQIVFKHFPLSAPCNSAVSRDLHPRACQGAWAAEAARRQGRFWPLHDALFETDGSDPRSAAQSIAAREGLDMARFDRECDDEATRAKVAADVELGQRCGVDRTPAIFLNGRRAPSTRLRSISLLIERES
jgi:protein-disulfide isomerase/uncharacterized membrane protein